MKTAALPALVHLSGMKQIQMILFVSHCQDNGIREVGWQNFQQFHTMKTPALPALAPLSGIKQIEMILFVSHCQGNGIGEVYVETVSSLTPQMPLSYLPWQCDKNRPFLLVSYRSRKPMQVRQVFLWSESADSFTNQIHYWIFGLRQA
jgi:hypothetical protein